MAKEKRYVIHFRYRDEGGLQDAVDRGLAKSKAAAVRWGKAIAAERGWWFIEAFEDPEQPKTEGK